MLKEFAASAAVMVLFAACAGEASTPPAGGPRTIEVTATDALTFEPSTVQVGVGETVRFVVTNQGATEHEFAVGDESTAGMFTSDQMMTPMEGTGGMEHGGAVAAVSLPGNATAEVTVTFQEAGSIPFACHLNGHDEAGMEGTITVG